MDGAKGPLAASARAAGKFAIKLNGKEQTFSSLPKEVHEQIPASELLVYECTGTETEIEEWFKTINPVPRIPKRIPADVPLRRAFSEARSVQERSGQAGVTVAACLQGESRD